MGHALASLLLSTLAVFVTGNVLSGVRIDNFFTALVVAIVLGMINSFIEPILLILSLPINILTLGLFTFVVMGFSVWLTSKIVPGFYLANFWWAIAFAVVLSLVNMFISALVK